jgi:hypothetical protein
MIKLFYDPHSLTWAQAGADSRTQKNHESAMAAGHYMLSGDFFENYEKFSGFFPNLEGSESLLALQETAYRSRRFRPTVLRKSLGRGVQRYGEPRCRAQCSACFVTQMISISALAIAIRAGRALQCGRHANRLGRIEAKGFDSEASLATPVSRCRAFLVREFAGPRHSQNDVVSANRPCGSRW